MKRVNTVKAATWGCEYPAPTTGVSTDFDSTLSHLTLIKMTEMLEAHVRTATRSKELSSKQQKVSYTRKQAEDCRLKQQLELNAFIGSNRHNSKKPCPHVPFIVLGQRLKRKRTRVDSHDCKTRWCGHL